jgi:hypothetical protein
MNPSPASRAGLWLSEYHGRKKRLIRSRIAASPPMIVLR